MEQQYSPIPDVSHAMPGAQVYRAVRGRLVLQGRSLRLVCLEKGVNRQNARDCLLGLWSGPKAKALFDDLCREAGLQ